MSVNVFRVINECVFRVLKSMKVCVRACVRACMCVCVCVCFFVISCFSVGVFDRFYFNVYVFVKTCYCCRCLFACFFLIDIFPLYYLSIISKMCCTHYSNFRVMFIQGKGCSHFEHKVCTN